MRGIIIVIAGFKFQAFDRQWLIWFEMDVLQWAKEVRSHNILSKKGVQQYCWTDYLMKNGLNTFKRAGKY